METFDIIVAHYHKPGNIYYTNSIPIISNKVYYNVCMCSIVYIYR